MALAAPDEDDAFPNGAEVDVVDAKGRSVCPTLGVGVACVVRTPLPAGAACAGRADDALDAAPTTPGVRASVTIPSASLGS